jgi:hypothetical protein
MGYRAATGFQQPANALQDPRDMVKDELLEPQSPAMETHILRHGM